jgi:preprotein translocase subunit SecD
LSQKDKIVQGLVGFLLLFSFFYVLPTFVNPDSLPGWWRDYLPSEPIHKGLDLQGGMHLILGVKTEKAVETVLEQTVEELKEALQEEKILISSAKTGRDYSVELWLVQNTDREKAETILDNFPQFERDVKNEGEKLKFILRLKDKEIERIKEYAINQGLETIRNRIDEFGVSEPTIQREGKNRILVQLPGVKDPSRAIKLIGRTALLEFKLVDEEHDLDAAVKRGRVPPGSEVLYERITDPQTGAVTRKPYLLKRRTLLTGNALTNARVGFDSEFSEPYVSMTFSRAGARRFARITEANVKKRLAIVLDGTVYSAPVIRERIGDGRAQISGQFTETEATDLAIVLRAGSLPAPVEIMEQRTVGPSLGHDSIQKGVTSILCGGILVLIFIVVYYRTGGLIANFALLFNLMLIMAALAALQATLTLPGIAGIVLTIGMAVDANVLIFERIREELRLGKSFRAALDGGYSKAFLTILDANLTTLIAALVLMQFGTGPIKGFAVTLSIGIAVSMFTAILVTRMIFDFILRNRKISQISI